jgi:hypothetical protein
MHKCKSFTLKDVHVIYMVIDIYTHNIKLDLVIYMDLTLELNPNPTLKSKFNESTWTTQPIIKVDKS